MSENTTKTLLPAQVPAQAEAPADEPATVDTAAE